VKTSGFCERSHFRFIFVAVAAAVIAAPSAAQGPIALQFSGPNGQVLSWDEDGNPGNWSQDNLPQFKNTCGDDPNEYVIREHVGDSTEFAPDTSERHRYVCADRPTDCAFNGSVYSQGQAVNLGGENEENGTTVAEPEVCLDDDPSMPGGEWYDLDDDRLRTSQLTNDQVDNLTRTLGDNPVLDELWGANPGTDTTSSFQGYATEDDCDPDLDYCDDGNQSSLDWFSGGEFVEGATQDNNLPGNSIGGIHNKMQESSNQFDTSADTITHLKNSYSGTPWKDDSLDTTPGPDNWGLSNALSDAITNNGLSKASGQCYFRDGNPPRTSIFYPSDRKVDKYFGNSYADNQGGDGVWEDPDDLGAGKLDFSCDLTRDRGLAYKKSSVTNSYRDGGRIYVGELKFERNPSSSLVEGLETPVCGDDESEYFIETVGVGEKGTEKNGAYMCANSPKRCVLPTPSGPELYETGDYLNLNESSEPEGRYKQDEEVCLNPSTAPTSKTLFNPLHGVWYDQDYSKKACNTNNLFGSPGVRWFDSDTVKEHPRAFTGGIDDDYNQFLDNQGRSTNASDQEVPLNGGTPVKTGTNQNKVLSVGFCGGDDGSEYLALQVCAADICETDRSHLGVAKEPGSCVYDGRDIYTDVPQPVDSDKHKRMLYNNGDQITLDYRQEQTITCVGGKWYEEGPIAFERSELKVPLGETSTAAFSVINLGVLRETYEVTVEEDTRAGVLSDVVGRPKTFTVQVEPKQSKDLSLEVRANKDFSSSERDITVEAEGLNSDSEGSDTLELNVTKSGNYTRQSDPDRNIPGITAIQLMALLAAASAVYFRLL